MIPHAARHIPSDLLAIVSAGSSVAAWQEQIDWSLRIIASLLAIAAGAYSLFLRYQKSRSESGDDSSKS